MFTHRMKYSIVSPINWVMQILQQTLSQPP